MLGRLRSAQISSGGQKSGQKFEDANGRRMSAFGEEKPHARIGYLRRFRFPALAAAAEKAIARRFSTDPP